MKKELSKIPYMGTGIGLREEIAEKILKHKASIGVLEIVTDNFLDKPARKLEWLKSFASEFPIIPHGVKLSIGSAIPLEEDYLTKIKNICELVNAPYYSEHFAITSLPGIDIGHLSPLWFTNETLDLVAEKINKIQDFLELPLVLENITSLFEIPGGDFGEPEFISETAKKTGCGVLLDLANIHINAYNRKKDPYEFLARMPLENTVQVHLAGGKISKKENWYHDTHSEEIRGINEGIWKLLEWTAARAPNLKAVVIERDQNFKEDFYDMILNDLNRAKNILRNAKS